MNQKRGLARRTVGNCQSEKCTVWERSKCALKDEEVQGWPWRSEGGGVDSYLTKAVKCKVTAIQPWTVEWRGQTRQHPLLRQRRYSSPVKAKTDTVTTIRRCGHRELYNCAPSMEWNLASTQQYWQWGLMRDEKARRVQRMDSCHYYWIRIILLKMELNVPVLPHCPFVFLWCAMWTPQQQSLWTNKFLISGNLPDSYILS